MIWAWIILGAFSAAAWLGSAVISPVLSETYWDGAPAGLIKRLKLGSALNAAGAFFAALSISLQTYALYPVS